MPLAAQTAPPSDASPGPSPGTGGIPEVEGEVGEIAEPEEAEEGEGGLDNLPGPVGYSTLSVAAVLPQIEASTSLCASAGAYAVDCLANQYEEIAKSLGENRLNAEAREILEEVAIKLRDTARRNQSPTLPMARVKTADGAARTTRPVIAVAPERQARAAAEAVAIISEAQTQLLRSPDSANRQAYVQIANVMESQKVLLRS